MTSKVMVLRPRRLQNDLMSRPATLGRVQAASAVYDCVMAGVFAFPVVAAIYLDTTLRYVHQSFGAVGTFPPFDPFHLLFVNLFGGLTIAWSTVRIIRRADPILAVSDAWLRYYFALLMIVYVAAWGAPAILYAFVASELVWGSVLLGVVHRSRSASG